MPASKQRMKDDDIEKKLVPDTSPIV